MHRIIIVVCVVFFLALHTSCHVQPVTENDKMVIDYFKMSTSEQIEHFKSLSIDQQYSVFIYGNQVRHPPAIYLAHPFAEQGEVIIPFLKSKLENAQKEVTIRDIVLVLSEIADLNLYDFKSDAALLVVLRDKIKDMSGVWKNSTEKMMAEIVAENKNNQGPDPN